VGFVCHERADDGTLSQDEGPSDSAGISEKTKVEAGMEPKVCGIRQM